MARQIEEKDVLQLVYKACPSFRSIAETELNEEKHLLYIVAGRFASHLLDLYKKQDITNFPLVAQFIESL